MFLILHLSVIRLTFDIQDDYKVKTFKKHTQSHIYTMLSLEERKTLQANLPINKRKGYKLIKEKLPHLTGTQISQAFLYDNRYKPEVMEAAAAVIEEYQKSETDLKKRVAKL